LREEEQRARGSRILFEAGAAWPRGRRSCRAQKARAGVETRWHDLRHFCATQLLELGLSHFDVSIQLGHTDGGALVMARYGHPSVDAAKNRLLRAFEWNDAGSGSATGSKAADS
jgi:integrase